MHSKKFSDIIHALGILQVKVAHVVLNGLNGAINSYALLVRHQRPVFIHKEIVDKFGLNGPTQPLRICWTNDQNVQELVSKIVNCKIRGQRCNKKYNITNLRTVENLDLPTQTVRVKSFGEQWNHLKNENIVPYENAKPMLLIGQENWELIVSRQVIQGSKNAPAVSRTNLGWIVHGRICIKRNHDERILLIKEIEIDQLHKLVKESFTLENYRILSPTKLIQSKEDEKAIEMMRKTSIKYENRWEIGLLWKEENVVLPEKIKNYGKENGSRL